ncbi:hypothetical protein BTURTLESOX_863 [bacterium endosymbiont of Bathymodiolus sp. 5 South]|nr:hypothetical protein BTURTLESOX_863 [bacterium endosymbiont of Bathymodiolus sp. 5 South]VVH63446.1 hypothetical protein BSPWISOX_1136 [uncultured Gammaproteobacteria bacterium]
MCSASFYSKQSIIFFNPEVDCKFSHPLVGETTLEERGS